MHLTNTVEVIVSHQFKINSGLSGLRWVFLLWCVKWMWRQLAPICGTEWRPRRESSDTLSTGLIVLFLPWWNIDLWTVILKCPICFVTVTEARKDKKHQVGKCSFNSWRRRAHVLRNACVVMHTPGPEGIVGWRVWVEIQRLDARTSQHSERQTSLCWDVQDW